MVDGQEKTYTVPGTANITIDGKPAQLGDVQKDTAVVVTLNGKDVGKVEVKSVTAQAPTAPADANKESGKVVSVEKGGLSLAEQTVTDLGAKHGFDVVCEKDGAIFTSKEFPTFDGFVFETTGDLTAERGTDGTPPMSADGKKALLDAVAAGKGFVGSHCGSDTFHSPGDRGANAASSATRSILYIAMLGGEFIVHKRFSRQPPLTIADPNWPGLKDAKDIEIMEEWHYARRTSPAPDLQR